jgi:hypothetical protein
MRRARGSVDAGLAPERFKKIKPTDGSRESQSAGLQPAETKPGR